MPPNCHLTSLFQADLPYLVELFIDPESRLFLGGPVHPALAEARSISWIKSSSCGRLWAIRRNEDAAFLGYVSLDTHHDGEDLEISYALLPRYWGQGHATEALRLALTQAFDQLKLLSVIAETQTKNLKSIKLLERVGMRPEKHLFRFGEEQVIYRIQSESFRESL